MPSKKVPTRDEISEEYKWNLADLFKDNDSWMEAFREYSKYPEQISAYAGLISEDADKLYEFLKFSDEVEEKIETLYNYASLLADGDLGNSTYQDIKGKAMGTYVAIAGAFSFSVPEIMSISDEKLRSFLEKCPSLSEYERKLYLIRREADHVLSPECEKILAMAGEMADTPQTVATVFKSADLKFPDVSDKDGNTHILTESSFVPTLEGNDRVLRSNAFKAYYGRFREYGNTLAATLNGQFKKLKFFADARNYESMLEASLFGDEIPVEVYHNLISAVNNNLDKLHRYVSLRKKILGYDELHMYDIYVPIVGDVAETIPYDEAKKTVFEALGVLGEDYTDILREGFDNRWIDVYENQGKNSGAYSTGTSRPHPYVLLNHKDNLNSMFTLAHEMGHAIHSYRSCRDQKFSTSAYTSFVAEVASTCNEVLLVKYLLSKTDDKKKRAYLINYFLDQFKGTIYRQAMFAEFELELAKLTENGDTLTFETISELYLNINKKYYGPDMISDDEIAFEWERIPHFYLNFYVFQYATGFSAAVAIANRILNEGAPAVEDYKKFLSGGNSLDPISLLKIAGVDMSTSKPVDEALGLFGSLIDEMESLL